MFFKIFFFLELDELFSFFSCEKLSYPFILFYLVGVFIVVLDGKNALPRDSPKLNWFSTKGCATCSYVWARLRATAHVVLDLGLLDGCYYVWVEWMIRSVGCLRLGNLHCEWAIYSIADLRNDSLEGCVLGSWLRGKRHWHIIKLGFVYRGIFWVSIFSVPSSKGI